MKALILCLQIAILAAILMNAMPADVQLPEPMPEPAPEPKPEVEPINLPSDQFIATAYSMGEVTRSGLPVDMGIIAVDPAVIPLGSVVHVEGYGYALAADTGEAIQGKRIDVFMPNETDAIQWGKKPVKVKVIRREEGD